MEGIMSGFSASERALLVPAADGSQDNARAFARLLRDRLTAAGLSGDRRDKAAHAVIYLMTAGQLVANFGRDIGAAGF
jgi:hypothetical protein